VIQWAAAPAGLAIGLVVWLGIFTALATVAVRSTAESVLSAGGARPAIGGPAGHRRRSIERKRGSMEAR